MYGGSESWNGDKSTSCVSDKNRSEQFSYMSDRSGTLTISRGFHEKSFRIIPTSRQDRPTFFPHFAPIQSHLITMLLTYSITWLCPPFCFIVQFFSLAAPLGPRVSAITRTHTIKISGIPPRRHKNRSNGSICRIRLKWCRTGASNELLTFT